MDWRWIESDGNSLNRDSKISKILLSALKIILFYVLLYIIGLYSK